MSEIKNILYLIQQAGTLMQTNRSHKRFLHTSFDSVASHTHLVSIIAYCVAKAEGMSEKQATKAVTMAMIHDLPEARAGDLDFVSKNYIKRDEDKAAKDQFKMLKFGKALYKLFEEYEDRKSKVSQCVRDADSLAQMYHEWVLSWQGNSLAKNWFEGDFVERVPYMFTKTAKNLAMAMRDSNPNEWWWTELVDKKGKVKTKEHLLGKNYRKK